MKLKTTLLLASTALLLTGCSTGIEYEPNVNYLKENGDASDEYKIVMDEEKDAEIKYVDSYEGKYIQFEVEFTYSGDYWKDFEGEFIGQVRESDDESFTGQYVCHPKGAYQILGGYSAWGFVHTKKHEFKDFTYDVTNPIQYKNDFKDEYTTQVKEFETQAVKETIKIVNTWLKSKDLPYLF